MQAGTSLLPHVNCNGAVMRHIPPPNNSSSFEVSAIFLLVRLVMFFVCGNRPEYDVKKI